ncbi:hypothetical protein CPB84DRAFT_1844737 [Gymnopilus junonius]|uniref:mRNA 3'-end-processing protein RNA14 n=1 Tax=Gymnopilus junonius TaxID=109634 RepID=A0A9P5TQN4_GYMJU|nr:hypothetical protein CPB84DRAFT_1844737 [Gymnopilus junonius]
MSTSEFAAADDESYVDYGGDDTQPTSEILSALAAVNSPVKTELQVEPQLPPPSEYDTLSAQLAENPHNPEAWRRLVRVAEDSRNLDRISAAYDALLKQYPNNATAQIRYITHFLNDQQQSDKVESLFVRFLKSSPCVELWKFYLTCVRRRNSAPQQRDTIRVSYEFALNHIGQDKDSGRYGTITFSSYKQEKCVAAATTWDQQQKMDALRRVYHRAVQIPLDNVERLWQELEAFETGLNKITAKKFMADLSPAHMQARTVLRQLINHTAPLFPSNANGPDMFLPSLPRFDASERALVGKWKAYLKWEEGNPLELDERDKPTLIQRIQMVYRKAVIRMRYYTEIWFMAYTWTNSVGKQDEALSILKAGLEANPSSFLLTFAYAEALEVKKEYQEVHTLYEKFLNTLRAQLEELEKSSANSSFSSAGAGPSNPNNNGVRQGSAGALPGFQTEPASNASSFNSQTSDPDKPPQATELQKRRTEYGLVWIMYMRFGMRAEGVKSSRSIFGRARRDRWAPWETYEASALMEYHCSDDKGIASRIFEKGMDVFGDEIEFVVRYLGFLISINDKNNARALFERVIPTFPPERARPLWERWARYEYQYGDLEAALRLEKRMAEVYPSDPPIKRLAQRHIYLGTDAIADRDLGFAVARRTATTAGSALGRSETSQSLLSGSQQGNGTGAAGGGPSTHGSKRPSSPDHRVKREDGRTGGDYAMGHKRQRLPSPGPPRNVPDRDRDGRWDGPSSRRRFSPAPAPPHGVWDRDDRTGPPPGGRREPMGRGGRDDDDGKRQQPLPGVLSWFIGELPGPNSFDGPVFRTDDLMNLFRNAVIPSTSARPKSPPPGPGRGRPPPDYGPYQGPNSGRGRRY